MLLSSITNNKFLVLLVTVFHLLLITSWNWSLLKWPPWQLAWEVLKCSTIWRLLKVMASSVPTRLQAPLIHLTIMMISCKPSHTGLTTKPKVFWWSEPTRKVWGSWSISMGKTSWSFVILWFIVLMWRALPHTLRALTHIAILVPRASSYFIKSTNVKIFATDLRLRNPAIPVVETGV